MTFSFTGLGVHLETLPPERGLQANLCSDKMFELIISLRDLLKRDYPENWIKLPISESP